MKIITHETNYIEIHPSTPIKENMFNELSKHIDCFIEHKGHTSLLIDLQNFKGWHSFHDFIKHIQFIQHHHRNVKKIAFMTYNIWQTYLPLIMKPFLKTKIHTFQNCSSDVAKDWILHPVSQEG